MGKQIKCKTVACVIKGIVELMSQSFMSQSLIRSGLVNIFMSLIELKKIYQKH